MNTTDMHRYERPEWNFALDVPRCWNAAPPVRSNSRYELIRFVSCEQGKHLLIVFRQGYNPLWSLTQYAEQKERVLARIGFGGFAGSPATLQSRPSWRLDLEKPEAWRVWSCRYYFIAEGLLLFRLGFGTSDKSGMFPVFERVAQSFAILSGSAWRGN